MKSVSRWLMVAASLFLLLLFAFPLWKITLEAPQFPDGLYMFIWINKISGSGDHILQNINILNHYVGMQPIEPDSIPELRYFPYVVVGLVVTGLLAAWADRKGIYFLWFMVLLLLSVLGLYDFYLWLYDYGHNLDPQAPIKVPGMAYQPPVLGRKELLNFVAHSYPAAGGVFLFISGVLSFLAFFMKKQSGKVHPGVAPGVLLLAALLVFSCHPEPRPIEYGKDECVHCRMLIVDKKYGAELVNRHGKVFPFDAVECMLDHLEEQPGSDSVYLHRMAVAYDRPGELFPAAALHYLISPKLPSPMGANLTAFIEREAAEEALARYGGTLYSWAGTREQLTDSQ